MNLQYKRGGAQPKNGNWTLKWRYLFGSNRARDNIHFCYAHGVKMPHFTSCMICIIILLTRKEASGWACVVASQRRGDMGDRSQLNLKRVRYMVDVHFGSL